MIGSRLLFSGYGVGFRAKPLHAGFLGQDALLIHDEAHLEHPFQKLLIAICEEQKRCGEFGKFHVMALSATSRAKGDAFGLTEAEKLVPSEIPDPPEKPLHVIWRRQDAKKSIQLHEKTDEGKLADEIAALALKDFKDSGCAILVFVRTVENVKKIVKKLPEGQTQQLTGTMRGFERDGRPCLSALPSRREVGWHHRLSRLHVRWRGWGEHLGGSPDLRPIAI
jgi:CRISPR-associated endonuclease/helicase Cas3